VQATQEQNQKSPLVPSPKPGLLEELRSVLGQVPDKTIFLLLLAVWLALFHFLGNATLGYINTPSLLEWMRTAYTRESPISDDGHAVLIPFVVVLLLWWKRKELLALPLRFWWPGLLLVAAALFVHVVGYAVQQPRVSIAALLGGIYALTGLVWGPAFLRATFFPFFLFGFMIPLGSLTEGVTFPLRLLVTKAVAWTCQHLLAIDVVSNGTQLLNGMHTYQYDVAPACSGIRSLVAITAVAIIYAFTVFRAWWPRVLILASAVPLAFIGNTFRMMVIVLAAELGGQGAGAKAHESSFWSLLPYVPAILGLMLLGRWLEKFQDRKPETGQPAAGGSKAA
jgi:exosortase